MDMGMGTPAADGFCKGAGTVMMNGFQASKGGYCILFLFKGGNVDTETKYAFALLGTMCLGIVTELFRSARALVAQRRIYGTANLSTLTLDLLQCFLFAVQMMVAYWLMLLVMLYEYVIFIFILLGLAIGHYLALRIHRKYLPPAADGYASGSPCCADGGLPKAPSDGKRSQLMNMAV